MLNEGRTPGPGSEYANVSYPSHSGNCDLGLGSVNPEMGLRCTKNNSSGTYCTSPGCVPKKWSDHNDPHCYGKGGGMAGQAPWQKKGKERQKDSIKGKEKGPEGEQTAQVVVSSNAGELKTTSATLTPGAIAMLATVTSHLRNLLCIVLAPEVEQSYLLGGGPSCTILDSGMTFHLICNRSLFWTYTPDNSVWMTTANHGTLNTVGRGDCLAILSIGGQSVCICLRDCLHAPDTMVNLLSAGRMVHKGWEICIKGNPDRCELIFNNESFGHIALTNYLCYLDVSFEQPCISSTATLASEFSSFAPAERTWDLWHRPLRGLA
ncbi:hypothetical protein OG21DRAFT_1491378 [Imleria badia]|nr:hypothetical protein OG21DRAFT_1491378 [Imleria badia]